MLESFANVALTILGISFLIFMHELGHYVAARIFDVRVETFSIGFGRRIAGFHKDGCDYRLSLIPLGGYVKMAGEYGDFEDETELDEGDLTSKPIWQRFIIFSAGVVVNIVLAFLIYPIAFGMGAPFESPVIGTVVPGAAAWRAGAEVGDEVVSVNDNTVYGFLDVMLEVALGDPEHTVLRVRRDGEELDLVIQPDRLHDRYDAGIYPPMDRALEVPVGGLAASAGLAQDDLLVEANGLRVGQLFQGRLLGPGEVLQRARETGDTLELTVERDGQTRRATVVPVIEPIEEDPRLLGAQALLRRVAALRGAAAETDFPLKLDDVVMEANGEPLLDAQDLFALMEAGPVGLTLERDGQQVSAELLDAHARLFLNGDVAFTYDSTHRHIQPIPRGALEEAGALPGDEIISLDGAPLTDYAALLEALRVDTADEVVDRRVGLRRGEQEFELDVRTRHREKVDYGLDLGVAMVRHDLDLTGSLVAGWDTSINALRNTAMTLGKLFTGSVGIKNLGGPIKISQVTYESAETDFAKLLLMLAMISVNLGFINILPIPVLDGGQIVFLLCEKVKGSRLSERSMQNAQLVGLVAILALMVVVTFNDVRSLFG
jgi:regulator of sigma E protease